MHGKVLWWNERDGNGIIHDKYGCRYYFDVSVLINRNITIKSGDSMSFNLNRGIKDTLCATNVKPLELRKTVLEMYPVFNSAVNAWCIETIYSTGEIEQYTVGSVLQVALEYGLELEKVEALKTIQSSNKQAINAETAGA